MSANRCFIVRFKDGTVRGIEPDPKDPLRLKIFLFGKNENEMAVFDPRGGLLKKLGPAKELGELKLALVD